MTGASLWLIPPAGTLTTTLQTLISTTLPSRIPVPVPDFQPHITITSGIPLSQAGGATDFQSLLDSLAFSSPPKIQFKRFRYGTAFWTAITIEIHKSISLKSLAVVCRSAILPNHTKEEAEQWVETYTTPAESGQEGFIPHLSLVYYNGDVDGETRMGLRSDVNDAGIRMEEGEKETLGEMEGWVGGTLTVVDTTKSVEQWKDSILAQRAL